MKLNTESGPFQDGDDREKNVREWLSRGDADHLDKLLSCGAIIVARLRMKVLEETKFTCSAGIAHNKVVLSKTHILASFCQQIALSIILVVSAVSFHNSLSPCMCVFPLPSCLFYSNSLHMLVNVAMTDVSKISKRNA